MAVKTLTEEFVRNIKPPKPPNRVNYFDASQRGRNLVLHVTYRGTKSWRVVHYVDGKPKTITFGRFDREGIDGSSAKPVPDDPLVIAQQLDYTLAGARAFCERFTANKVAYLNPGAVPTAARPGKEICRRVIERYLAGDAAKFRTIGEITRCMQKYVLPVLGDRTFSDIRRSDVTRLRDDIRAAVALQKGNPDAGQRMAAIVVAQLRAIMIWWEEYDDDYACPIRSRTSRTAGKKPRPRERHLSDPELRAFWIATGGADGAPYDTYCAFLRVLLLTAARRHKVATMRHQDIQNGVWSIPTEDEREKNHAEQLRLPTMVLEIIRAQKPIAENPYVFAISEAGPMNGWSKNKARLDERLAIAPWRLHDLRRTASGLMNRTEHPHIVERVLGHSIGGVAGTYNQHQYFDEKAKALAALADTVMGIVLARPT